MEPMPSTVLLVEDDPDLRDLLADLLRMRGHDVRIATNGVAALREIDDRFPQLVISDLEMPLLDGQALIFRLFVEDLGRENVPVILMSASTRLDKVAQAVGTPYTLAKPFSGEALEALVHRALSEAIPPRPPAGPPPG